MKKWLFLRWALIVSITCVGAAFAVNLGAIGYIKANDASNLSFVILALCAAMTLYCGVLTYRAGEKIYSIKTFSGHMKNDALEDLRQIETSADNGWYSADLCEKIGLIGTVVGFLLALQGLPAFSGTDQPAMQKLISELAIGISTALITTFVGMVCGIILTLQYQNLGMAIDRTLLRAKLDDKKDGGDA